MVIGSDEFCPCITSKEDKPRTKKGPSRSSQPLQSHQPVLGFMTILLKSGWAFCWRILYLCITLFLNRANLVIVYSHLIVKNRFES